MKTTNYLIALAFVSIFLLSAPSVPACESMGPNKHVGPVLSIDAEEGSFTIRDAESGTPITFEASRELIQGLTLNGRVLVSYQDHDGRLVAKEIQS